MDEFAVAAYLGRTALAGAVVLALGRAALLLARAPATRQRLAAGTLHAAALVPLLTLLPSWWAVTVPAAAPVVAVETAAAEPAAVPGELPALSAEWVAGPEFAEVEAPALDEVEPAPVAVEPAAVAAPRPRGWRDAVGVAAAVYAAGVGYFLGVFALGHLALVRLRRGATAAPGRVRAVWGSRRPALLVHDGLASPVCFGVVRPAVVLPSGLARTATAGQLAWVLAHEAEHLRRGDPLTGWFAGLAKALFFFAPWFWGVRRELRLAQEYLADAAALAAGGPAADYAEFLVDLTAAPVRGRRTLLAHGVRAGRSDLSRRITMVLSTTPPRAPRRWAAPAAAGLFAAAVALSGVTIVRADDKPKGPPAAPQPLGDKPRGEAKPPEGKPDRVVETRRADDAQRDARIFNERPRPTLANLEELRKGIDEALAAGKTAEARKLIDGLVNAMMWPHAAPQPPAGDRRGVMAIESADPRIMDALTAMRKAIDAAKDPEARAAMETAFRLLRDMPQDRKMTQTFVGPDGRATVVQHGPAGSAQWQTTIRPQPGDARPAGFNQAVLTWAGAARHPEPSATLMSLGLSVAPVPEALAEQLQLPPATGLLVTAVHPGSPLAEAGAQKNDIVVKVNGVAVAENATDLIGKLDAVRAGERSVIVVMRKGKEVALPVAVPRPTTTRLDRPAPKKVQFESMKLEFVNGRVSIEAKKGDRQYKITGTRVGEQLDKATITISNLKTGQEMAQEGTDLNRNVEEEDRAAVQTLLDQIRGR